MEETMMQLFKPNHHFNFARLVIHKVACRGAQIMRIVGHVLDDDKLIIIPVIGTDLQEVIVNDNRFLILIFTTRQSITYTSSPVIGAIIVKNDGVQHTTCI
jgi:hypothetical protein